MRAETSGERLSFTRTTGHRRRSTVHHVLDKLGHSASRPIKIAGAADQVQLAADTDQSGAFYAPQFGSQAF